MADRRILVVDDDLSMREFLAILLRRDGYAVDTAASAEDALGKVSDQWPDLVLTDLNMPGADGIELLREVKARGAKEGKDVEVIVVTAYGSTRSAVDAMLHGAANYVLKPFDNKELRMVVRRALGRRQLEVENTRLKAELQDRYHFGNLVGSSKAMTEVYDLIRRVKDTRINCLIVGESGTGKEMVARAIHFSGARADGPFVPINCGAIPESLVESELFGHKKGSFTGAVRDKMGLIKAADKGTLFLDEVASLPAAAQVSLLRALQERRFTPVGSVNEVEVDTRILAACNIDLEDAVREGTFREDLFYRLDVVQIDIPPLRARAEDILLLVRHFVKRYAAEYQKAVASVSPDTMKLMRAWHYPGNVRELQNLIERAVALCEGTLIEPSDLPARLLDGATTSDRLSPTGAFPGDGLNLDALLSRTEKQWLLAALDEAAGNKTRAARLLKLSFRSLRYRLAKYDLDTVN